MKLLGVETSSPLFSVAVSDGPRVLTWRQVEGQGRPSALLTDLIQEALGSAGLTLAGLDGFAISIGPGSFTGLRVGVMTVKTLAWALKKPVLPVSSLEVLAHGAEPRNGPGDLHLFLDARKGNVYWAQFRPDGAGLQRAHADALLRPEEALRRVQPPALLVGDGLRSYAGRVASALPHGIQLAPEALWTPRAESLCRIAHARWPEGVVDDPHRLVPHYLYTMQSDIIGR